MRKDEVHKLFSTELDWTWKCNQYDRSHVLYNSSSVSSSISSSRTMSSSSLIISAIEGRIPWLLGSGLQRPPSWIWRRPWIWRQRWWSYRFWLYRASWLHCFCFYKKRIKSSHEFHDFHRTPFQWRASLHHTTRGGTIWQWNHPFYARCSGYLSLQSTEKYIWEIVKKCSPKSKKIMHLKLELSQVSSNAFASERMIDSDAPTPITPRGVSNLIHEHLNIWTFLTFFNAVGSQLRCYYSYLSESCTEDFIRP